MLGILRVPPASSTSAVGPDGLSLPGSAEVTVVVKGKSHDVLTNADTVGQLLSAMGINAGTESVVVEGTTYIDVWAEGDSDDMALLIGKHGHTLDALQELLRGHIQRSTEERCLVQVDVEDYRKRRSSRVAQRAKDAARRVQKSGRPETMEPMSALERKIVHNTVATFKDLETASQGEEPQRSVVIRRRR